MRDKEASSGNLMHIGLKIAGLMLGLVGVSAAAGRHVEPFVTGTVYDTGLMLGRSNVSSGGATEAPLQLSRPQLRELDSWIDAHQSKLHMILASPPPPSCSVLLSDADERRIQLDLYSVNESWRHAVQIRISDKSGKFVYGGEMTLPSTDTATLREILKPPA